MYNILIADDELFFAKCLTPTFERYFRCSVDTATTPYECKQKVKVNIYHGVVLDIKFGSSFDDGFTLIQTIRTANPEAKILMYSNSDEAEVIAKARALGVDEFISKPRSNSDEVAVILRKCLVKRDEESELFEYGKRLAFEVGAAFVSEVMGKVFADVARYCNAKVNILITGPTGCGKELVAQAFRRKERPFRALNCAAISKELVVSTFFGHTRGSFTGAVHDQAGIFELANGGDVFLDEVAELSLEGQASLLRFLETRELQRVGSGKIEKVNVRIISATNENLEELVKAGKFRQDLLARLKGAHIEIPRLAERPEDILPIVRKMLADLGKTEVELSKDLEYMLGQLTWPQNVRQLRQTIEQMCTGSRGKLLTIADLPNALLKDLRSLVEVGKADGEFILVRVPGNTTFEVATKMLFQEMVAFAQRNGKLSQRELGEKLGLARSVVQKKLTEISNSKE